MQTTAGTTTNTRPAWLVTVVCALAGALLFGLLHGRQPGQAADAPAQLDVTQPLNLARSDLVNVVERFNATARFLGVSVALPALNAFQRADKPGVTDFWQQAAPGVDVHVEISQPERVLRSLSVIAPNDGSAASVDQLTAVVSTAITTVFGSSSAATPTAIRQCAASARTTTISLNGYEVSCTAGTVVLLTLTPTKPL